MAQHRSSEDQGLAGLAHAREHRLGRRRLERLRANPEGIGRGQKVGAHLHPRLQHIEGQAHVHGTWPAGDGRGDGARDVVA